jgi:ABC-type nickel/cobalt efflux system permease component RcnA
MDGMLATLAAVGFVLGLRHALDPDHVVAVTTLVSERSSLRRASVVGASWGLGHAAALLLCGGAVLVLKLSLPAGLEAALEAAVAAMLIALGSLAVRAALRYRLHAHAHAHEGREHVHFHAHPAGDGHGVHAHRHPLGEGVKPFLVGAVHGLAGSGALALLALGAAPSLPAGLAYIGMLGVGSIAGMLLLSVLMSLPLAFLQRRYSLAHNRIQLAAGLASMAFGLWLLGRNAAGFVA